MPKYRVRCTWPYVGDLDLLPDWREYLSDSFQVYCVEDMEGNVLWRE